MDFLEQLPLSTGANCLQLWTYPHNSLPSANKIIKLYTKYILIKKILHRSYVMSQTTLPLAKPPLIDPNNFCSNYKFHRYHISHGKVGKIIKVFHCIWFLRNASKNRYNFNSNWIDFFSFVFKYGTMTNLQHFRIHIVTFVSFVHSPWAPHDLIYVK